MGINGLPATSTSPAAGSSSVPGTAISLEAARLEQLQKTVIGVANAPESPGTPDKSLAGFESLDQKTSPDVTSRFTQSTAASAKADAPTPSDSRTSQNKVSDRKQRVHFPQEAKLVTVRDWEDIPIEPVPSEWISPVLGPQDPGYCSDGPEGESELDSSRYEIHGTNDEFRLVKKA